MLPSSQVEFDRWIGATSPAEAARESLKVVYGVWLRSGASMSLAGFVGVEALQRFHGAGLWYGLDRTQQGRGTAKTGALLAMADFSERCSASGMRRPPRWVLHALPRNERSCGLATSLGFRRDEMLDYTRSMSSRGGQRFHGFMLARSAAQLAAEAQARLSAGAMRQVLTSKMASNEPVVTKARLRA
jgi:RimJ/RimL family protein N-acetyltransferase